MKVKKEFTNYCSEQKLLNPECSESELQGRCQQGWKKVGNNERENYGSLFARSFKTCHLTKATKPSEVTLTSDMRNKLIRLKAKKAKKAKAAATRDRWGKRSKGSRREPERTESCPRNTVVCQFDQQFDNLTSVGKTKKGKLWFSTKRPAQVCEFWISEGNKIYKKEGLARFQVLYDPQLHQFFHLEGTEFSEVARDSLLRGY